MYCIILWICLCQPVLCSAKRLCCAYCHVFPVSSDTVRTWMHPGCCTDPIPIIWVPRAHRRPGGSYHHLLTATVAPRLLQRPHPHHLGPESTSQTRRILPTPPDCLSRTQGAVTRGPTINHGLPSTPSPIWTLPALPLHELNCP